MKKFDLLRRHERYDRLVNSLLEEVSTLSDEALNRKPASGGWSAMQTMHHLILVEVASMAYLRKKLSFNPEFKKAGLGSHLRFYLLQVSLSLPIKFRAPAPVADDKLPAYATLADTRTRWQEVRAEWTAFLTQMPDGLLDKEVYKHARAGKLGWGQMLGFFETHFKRHLKQLRAALKN